MTALFLLSLLCFSAVDDQPVAQAEDITFDRADFGEWLVERIGYVHVQDYLSEQLALHAAEQRGLLPTEAEVEQAYEEERRLIIERFHRGDEARFGQDLEARGQSVETNRVRRTNSLRFEMALGNLARESRVVDEAVLEKRYGEVYGNSGEHVVLDVLFYNTFAFAEPDATKEMIPEGQSLALERAQAGRAALEAGASMEELLEGSDPPSSEFIVDGRIGQYRKRLLGTEVEQAVQSLDDPGDIGGPVRVWDGFWVIQLVSRQEQSFEEARPTLIQLMRDDPVTSEEMVNESNRLLEQYRAEVLLH